MTEFTPKLSVDEAVQELFSGNTDTSGRSIVSNTLPCHKPVMDFG